MAFTRLSGIWVLCLALHFTTSAATNNHSETCEIATERDENHDAFPGEIVKFPKMTEEIRAILHSDWSTLGGDDILEVMKTDGVLEFAHGKDSFYTHLAGTFGVLKAWNQPDDISYGGILHTAYSGDLFQFFLWDAMEDKDRSTIQDLIGKDAEALVYLFGTINRGHLGGFEAAQANATIMKPFEPNDFYMVRSRVAESQQIEVTSEDAAKLLMVTIADYIDQMVDTNGWRDHHQVEIADRLYPGDGRPAVAFYWFSNVCHAIKPLLEVTPPIFNHCSTILDIHDETKARDAYWYATLNEPELDDLQLIHYHEKAVFYNPFIAEPHVMLSQIYFRQGKFYEAAVEARQAIEKFYTLATNWDKRRSYTHWVGFARMLLLRSNRRIQDLTHLPYHDTSQDIYTSAKGLNLVSLHDIAAEMKSYEELYYLIQH